MTINPAHLISSAGGRGVQPPVSTNRDAFHYLRHSQGQRNAIPATLRVLGLRPLCGEPQNGDRDCIGGVEIKTHSIPFNPAHLISSLGGREVQPPVSTNRDAFHYLIRPWGFTIVHPRRCGEPQQCDGGCIAEAEITLPTLYRLPGIQEGRGPASGGRVQYPCKHTRQTVHRAPLLTPPSRTG